ncbi:hypothetical protein [Paenibacillus sp. Leaf72]|uniref:hypothetical protein n=1 Tax=Paenibacillus sp. Leaf72 TaxID=1736234 RepID=UPI0006FFDAE9|nr:hypothetical protein [Paenibacillus sp. Leaf72]KQN97010.1 hypothetical protein ASF12_23360 [Paenibacillus sp. Leaf72]
MKFNVLVEKAKKSESETAIIDLVTEVKLLHEVFILMNPQDSDTVYFGELEGTVWMFVYTSLEQLRQSARLVLEEDAPVYYVTIPTDAAFSWIAEHEESGVYGIRINQGPYGFWVSLDDLKDNNSEESQK